jgi:uncharacterized protein YjiS (DUF1127 family)
MIRTLLQGIARQRERARAADMLHRFDDYQLRDLGITRDQIDLFVSGQM